MIKKLIVYSIISLTSLLLISGCGRKGALEPPPSAQVDAGEGNVQEKSQEDKSFILDRLIQ